MCPEAARLDPDVFTCQTCPVEAQYAALAKDPLCLKVWLLWQKVGTRFNFDGHCVGQVFERLTRDEDHETYDLLVQGMAILYHAFCPPEKAPEE